MKFKLTLVLPVVLLFMLHDIIQVMVRVTIRPAFSGLVPPFSWQIPLFALLKQKSFITGVETLLYVKQETMTFGVISKKKKVKTCLDARFVQF